MNYIKQQIAKLAEYDIKSHASLLKWTTLIIWACSLVAEVGTFAFNKKLPDKEKSFIIKQELTAGGISLGIMYLLADRFEKFGAKLVTEGKLLPGELPERLRRPEVVQKILDADPAFMKKELQGNTNWVHRLGGFRKGISVVSGLIGTIIAFNITTPLISNKIASYFQNKTLAAKTAHSNQNFQPNLGQAVQSPHKQSAVYQPPAVYGRFSSYTVPQQPYLSVKPYG